MSKEQLTREDVDGMFAKFQKGLENLFAPKKAEVDKPTNKIVQDSTGAEIDFTELAEDANPFIGDTAVVENVPANGEYLMPSGVTYEFTDGELTAIKKEGSDAPDEALTEATEKVEQLEASIVSKDAEIAEFTNKIETITNEFTEFKNTITSSYTPEKKELKEEKGEVKERKLFKD